MAIAPAEIKCRLLAPPPDTRKDLGVTTEPVGQIPTAPAEPPPFTATPGEWMRLVALNRLRNYLIEAEKRAQEDLRGTF